MHKKNVDLLRNEALRLLALEQQILQEIIKDANLLTEPAADNGQSLDTQSAPKVLEVLKGEQLKLDHLEMTLAVVGTMKAGKSTTINAIVGTEVLPNRNRPMTALPTLIRHTPGQVEPVLKFDNDQPIQTLLGELRTASDLPENQEELEKFLAGEGHDLQDLLQRIRSNHKYQQRYQGAEQIFEFLKGLNDLVRLSRCLQVEFPFVDYDEVHELPVIEVEFAHLRELEQVNGRFTLLDTPGPNEANQPDLKKMLREQLRAASAVLAVLDFTQLKSEADAEVRDELNDIAESTKGRLYTLVNKFDQKDRNSDSADKIRSYVATDLMNGNIKAENVFPVSSRWGYLANRARHELTMHKRLPDPENSPWVADFGDDALGRRWQRDIDDVEKVTEAAEELWKDSLFDAPLHSVIQTAYANASFLSLQSAASKLTLYTEKISNFINARDGALKADVATLKGAIDSLKNDVATIENCHGDATGLADEMLKELHKKHERVFSEIKESVEKMVDEYFKKEAQRHVEALEKECKAERKNRKANLVAGLMSALNVAFSSKNKPNKGSPASSNPPDEIEIIEFGDKNDAKKFIDAIAADVNKKVASKNKELIDEVKFSVQKFEDDFVENIVKKMQTIIGGISDALNRGGFDIAFTLPPANDLKLPSDGSIMIKNIIENKSRTVTKYRRQSGFWGSICSFFDTDDWGWEEYEEKEKYAEICLPLVQKKIDESITNLLSEISKDMKLAIEEPMQKNITQYFGEIKEKVENLRGDLLQGMRDQKKHHEQKEAMMKFLAAVKKKLLDLKNDGNALELDISASSFSGQKAAQ